MKVSKTIGAWLSAQREQHRVKMSERREALLRFDSERMVQVREFRGQLYLCYDDAPIVPLDMLKTDIGSALGTAREAYVKYNQSHKRL